MPQKTKFLQRGDKFKENTEKSWCHQFVDLASYVTWLSQYTTLKQTIYYYYPFLWIYSTPKNSGLGTPWSLISSQCMKKKGSFGDEGGFLRKLLSLHQQFLGWLRATPASEPVFFFSAENMKFRWQQFDRQPLRRLFDRHCFGSDLSSNWKGK